MFLRSLLINFTRHLSRKIYGQYFIHILLILVFFSTVKTECILVFKMTALWQDEINKCVFNIIIIYGTAYFKCIHAEIGLIN